MKSWSLCNFYKKIANIICYFLKQQIYLPGYATESNEKNIFAVLCE